MQNLPFWPFEPNWANSVTETREWLTDVMTSPTGSEQRRSLRVLPRRSFEFSIAVYGDERRLLDNLLISYSGRQWYFPLWHDVNLSSEQVLPGSRFIPCTDAALSNMKAGTIACLLGDDPYTFELFEIDVIGTAGITVVNPITGRWPEGTRIYPVRLARLTDSPEQSKNNGSLTTAQLRFQIVEPGRAAIVVPLPLDSYRSFNVMRDPPTERQPLNIGMERMLVELDNQISLPTWVDTAIRPFTYQQYAWVITSRDELRAFEHMLDVLRGRAVPMWMPTFMDDFTLVQDATAGATAMVVGRSGFTLAGGPRWDRQDIRIETMSGIIYRRILDVALNSNGNETLILDQALPDGLAVRDAVMISFMTLMRLNQDSIQIDHLTDSKGVATAVATFRSTPETRKVV